MPWGCARRLISCIPRTVNFVSSAHGEPDVNVAREFLRANLSASLPLHRSQQIAFVGLQPIESRRIEGLGLGEAFTDGGFWNEISGVFSQIALLAQLV